MSIVSQPSVCVGTQLVWVEAKDLNVEDRVVERNGIIRTLARSYMETSSNYEQAFLYAILRYNSN